MTSEKVKRSQVRTFIDVDPDYQDWALVGDGVTSAEIAYNPEISSEVYIHQDSASSEIEAYAPTMAIEAIAIKGDEVFDFVDALRKTRATLDAAHTQICNVWLYDEVYGETGVYRAEVQDVAISIDTFGGEGGQSNKINYTIHYCGDPVLGDFDLEYLTFSEDS